MLKQLGQYAPHLRRHSIGAGELSWHGQGSENNMTGKRNASMKLFGTAAIIRNGGVTAAGRSAAL